MKKIFGILVLSLLIFNTSFSDEKKYSLFGVELGDDVSNYNPREGINEHKILIDPPKPNNNFILYWASINKKTNKIIIIGGIHKKNYLYGNENIEREALIKKAVSISRKCKIDNEVFAEVISKGSQFKNFNNNLEEFKSSLDSTSLYIFDGNKIDYGENGNIKFSIGIHCINRYGTLVEGEESGMRADISLTDFRTLYQTIEDNKNFEKEQLDKSGLQ